MGPFAVSAEPGKMQGRAAATDPLPPYPDPPPVRSRWQRWGWLPGCAALGAVIGELTYRLGGGVSFWGFVGCVAPAVWLLNRYGAARPKKRWGWGWRQLALLRRGRPQTRGRGS